MTHLKFVFQVMLLFPVEKEIQSQHIIVFALVAYIGVLLLLRKIFSCNKNNY